MMLLHIQHPAESEIDQLIDEFLSQEKLLPFDDAAPVIPPIDTRSEEIV